MGKDVNSLVNGRFEGPKGRIMLQLQKSFRDERFKLTKKFQDDIDVNKLSNSFKQTVDKDVLNVPKKQKEVSSEQQHQLQILNGMGIRKKIVKKPMSIVHRFDPQSTNSQKLLKQLESEKRRKQIEQNTERNKQKKRSVQIHKGIDRTKNNIQKANRLLMGEEQPPQNQPPKHYQIKVNGSKSQAFQSSSFKLF